MKDYRIRAIKGNEIRDFYVVAAYVLACLTELKNAGYKTEVTAYDTVRA
jgi:hypothetical protein